MTRLQEEIGKAQAGATCTVPSELGASPEAGKHTPAGAQPTTCVEVHSAPLFEGPGPCAEQRRDVQLLQGGQVGAGQASDVE